jgi:glycosyltransferase 2 family protein
LNFRKFVIQALKFLGFLALGILLLWLAFRKVDFNRVGENLKQANYYWIVLSLIFSLLAFILRARRWQLLIHPLGFHPTFWHTFHALMIGYMANIALPRIGEVTRCVVLGKKEKIAVDKLIGTVIIERTIDFLSILIFLILIIITSESLINKFLKESIFMPLREKVLSVVNIPWELWALLVLIAVAAMYLMIRYRKSLRKFRFFAKIFDVVKGVITGLKTITNLNRKWEFIFLTIGIWLSYAIMTWVVVFCLKNTSNITFWDSLIILVVGGLAMSVPVQAGFGAFHWAVAQVLIVMHGINREDGFSFAILSHESQIIFEILVGLISAYVMYGRNHKNKTADNT